MKKQNKKGIALQAAFPAVLTLILVAILVIMGIYMIVALQGTFTDLSSGTANESITLATGVATSSNATLCNFEDFGVTAVYNGTGGALIPATNYTVDASAGTLTNKSASDLVYFSSSTWLVESTFNWGGPSCTGAKTTITQFGTYPALIGLVGTIIFLGLVIGILVASFAFGGRKGV